MLLLPPNTDNFIASTCFHHFHSQNNHRSHHVTQTSTESIFYRAIVQSIKRHLFRDRFFSFPSGNVKTRSGNVSGEKTHKHTKHTNRTKHTNSTKHTHTQTSGWAPQQKNIQACCASFVPYDSCPARPHTHARARVCMYARVHAHTHTRTHARPYTRMYVSARTYANVHARAHARAHIFTHSHRRAHHTYTHIAHCDTHTHTNTHTHTHTHPHTPTHAALDQCAGDGIVACVTDAHTACSQDQHYATKWLGSQRRPLYRF